MLEVIFIVFAITTMLDVYAPTCRTSGATSEADDDDSWSDDPSSNYYVAGHNTYHGRGHHSRPPLQSILTQSQSLLLQGNNCLS